MKPLGCLLGASWDSSWAAWGHLGASWDSSWGAWGHLGAILGGLGGPLRTSWSHLGAILGDLEGILGGLGRSRARQLHDRSSIEFIEEKITLTKQAACPHRDTTSIAMIRATRGQVDR